ncbi:hypothetical protein ACOBV9_04310 [Pseudoalteromonas espejiana]
MDWVIYDLVTIFALISCFLVIKKSSPSFIYLMAGLLLNMLLAFSMYLDVNVFKNQETVVPVGAYSFIVFSSDLLMVVALIVDRDFLGLHKLKYKLLSLFKSQKPQPTT